MDEGVTPTTCVNSEFGISALQKMQSDTFYLTYIAIHTACAYQTLMVKTYHVTNDTS